MYDYHMFTKGEEFRDKKQHSQRNQWKTAHSPNGMVLDSRNQPKQPQYCFYSIASITFRITFDTKYLRSISIEVSKSSEIDNES